MKMDDSIGIDFSALIEEVKNQLAKKLILSIVPDTESKEFLVKMLDIYQRNGVDAMTAVSIMAEMSKEFGNRKEEQE